MPENYASYQSSAPTPSWPPPTPLVPVSAPPQIMFTIRKPDVIQKAVMEERVPLAPDIPAVQGRGGRRGRYKK